VEGSGRRPLPTSPLQGISSKSSIYLRASLTCPAWEALLQAIKYSGITFQRRATACSSCTGRPRRGLKFLHWGAPHAPHRRGVDGGRTTSGLFLCLPTFATSCTLSLEREKVVLVLERSGESTVGLLSSYWASTTASLSHRVGVLLDDRLSKKPKDRHHPALSLSYSIRNDTCWYLVHSPHLRLLSACTLHVIRISQQE
jgi:hypothetical protein